MYIRVFKELSGIRSQILEQNIFMTWQNLFKNLIAWSDHIKIYLNFVLVK